MSRGRDRGLGAALRHRDYRYLIAAFTLSDIGTWAYNVALTVWVFEATGSLGWVAAATMCRFVPAVLCGAYAGVVAERHDKASFMRTVDLAFAAVMVAMAIAMTLGAPVLVVLATAACSSVLSTAYDPAAAALTPHVVPERDLASANALRNTVDNVAVIAGPALGALLLLAGPPQNAVWINAATFLVSAVLVSRVRTRTPAVDTSEGGELGLLRQMTTGVQAISTSPTTSVMVGFCILATLIFGADTVLFVAASQELLGTGPDGYGYLLAGLGVGGVLAAPLVTRLEARPALGPVILGGMAAYTLPTLVLLVTHEPAVAFAAQVVRGAGTLVVDVLAVSSLQRVLPADVLARVFGAFDTVLLLAVLVGSLLTSLVIETAGVRAAVWVIGAGMFALSLAGLPWLRRLDAAAALRRAELAPRVALLERCDLLEQTGDGDLVQLAGEMSEVRLPAGTVVIREGDAADAFLVVVEGELAVTTAVPTASPIPPVTAGGYVGEIGLLEGSPRTATVTATTDVVLLRAEAVDFLDVLTSARPSAAFIDGAALRLGRTHPARAMTVAALAPVADRPPGGSS